MYSYIQWNSAKPNTLKNGKNTPKWTLENHSRKNFPNVYQFFPYNRDHEKDSHLLLKKKHKQNTSKTHIIKMRVPEYVFFTLAKFLCTVTVEVILSAVKTRP